MSRKRFHGLKKIKVRATWNKFNLFNLSRIQRFPTFGTYYQQKWKAKSLTRSYHGEHIREKQWERMFRPRMAAVVPMDPKYLAEHDGSEFAAGRGSGKEMRIQDPRARALNIPYMHMTYAPMERRLDMAVWRALFASSARQARQFVTHGMVKVNGQKMPYAGYLLNPGDMFQVEPESVLYATGAPKNMEQIRAGRVLQRKYRRMNKGIRVAGPKKARAITKATKASEVPQPIVPVSGDIEEVQAQRRIDFRDLFNKVQLALEEKSAKAKIGAKRKQDLRALAKELKTARGTINRKTETELNTQLKDFNTKFARIQKLVTPDQPAAQQKKESQISQKDVPLTKEEDKQLQEAIARARENPIDESKPYATPWKPRPYMSAFAFIPRYLEVNHNICSAVYLRHPVARPGMTEVPTPFQTPTYQLAFNWYLRRR